MNKNRDLAKRILSLVMIFAVVFSYSGAIPIYGGEDGGEPPVEGDVGTNTDLPKSPRLGGSIFGMDISEGRVLLEMSGGKVKLTGTPFGGSEVTVEFEPGSAYVRITGQSDGTNSIVVDGVGTSDVPLEILLASVTIDVQSGNDNCAFELANDSVVDLTFVSDNTLKSGANRAGIEVPEGSSLIINKGGIGSLTACSNGYGAGIGGNGSTSGNGETAGNITINGGTVTAYSSETNIGYGAGIGGGGSYNQTAGNGGNVTIEGGTVTAYSSGSGSANGAGAGIGGGGSKTNTAGAGGIIAINGGTVTAYSSETGKGYGAGIGGGGSYTGTPGAGVEITIEKGTVNAYSSKEDAGRGAGIGGGGTDGSANGGAGGKITISGETTTITAQSGALEDSSGAGIGGGGSKNGTAGNGGTIKISGGTITACSSTATIGARVFGAGIGGGGSGEKGSGNGGNSGTIEITGGTITAYSTKGIEARGAGIGGGGSRWKNAGVGESITIGNATITAFSSETKDGWGAGIGGGGGEIDGGDGGTITINSGNITAYSSNKSFGYGAGIGGGFGGKGNGGKGGKGGTINISGGLVSAYSSESSSGYGSGIGGCGNYFTKGGDGGTVTISGGTVNAFSSKTSSGDGTGIGGGYEAADNGTLKITGGSVQAKKKANATDASVPSSVTNGTKSVYLLTTTLSGITDKKAVTNAPVSGYGMDDVYTDTAGKVYFWLPADTYSSLSLSADSKTFAGSATVATNNTNAVTLPNYAVTLTVNKDGSAWGNHGKTFGLYKGTSLKHTGTGTGATVTFSGVLADTYDIKEIPSSGSAIDTEVDFVVSSTSTAQTLNYYTVSFTPSDSGLASGSSISARYNNKSISSGDVVLGGKTLSLTVTRRGTGTTYTYAWTGDGTNSETTNTLTKTQLAEKVNATCTVTGIVVPSAPQNLVATAAPRYGEVDLAWEAPASDGYGAITGYEYFCTGATDWVATGSTDLSVTVKDLALAMNYEFKVRAVNQAGKGAESNIANATVCGYPTKPTNLTAVVGKNEATLSWTAPSSDGGAPITGYEYSMDGGTTWVSTGSTDLTTIATGLEGGKEYTFIVCAVTGVGKSFPSDSVTVTVPHELPSEPTDLAVSDITETTAKLSWTAPSSSGSAPITAYEYSTDGGITWTSTRSTNTSITITGLRENTAYEFKVRAVNAGGAGSESVGVKTTTKNSKKTGGGKGAGLSQDPVESTVKEIEGNIVKLPEADKTLLNEITDAKQPSIVLDKDKIGAEIDKEVLESGNKAGFDYVDIKNDDVTLSVPTSIKDSLNDQTGDVLTAIIAPSEKELPTATKGKLESISKSNEELLKDTFDIEVTTEKGRVAISEPLKVTVDISNMSEAEKNRLTGIVLEADGTYKQLGGEVSEDGNSFTFYTYDQGTHGVVVSDSLTKLSLTIGNNDYLLNGATMPNDVAPFVSDEGRTMVPIRVVSEALGCKVGWDAATQQVTITQDGNTLVLTIGEDLPAGMGKAVLAGGRTFVPLRYVSEMLGANVVWDKATKSVRVYV